MAKKCEKISLVFWSMRRYHNFLLRFTDLYGSNFCNLHTLVVWMPNLKLKSCMDSKIHSQIWSWNPSVRVMGLACLPYAFLTRQKGLIAGHSAPWLKANRAFLGCLTNLCRLSKIIGRALHSMYHLWYTPACCVGKEEMKGHKKAWTEWR